MLIGRFREFSHQTKFYGLAQIPPTVLFDLGEAWRFVGRLPTGMNIFTPKGGKRTSILCWPFWVLICDRSARFPFLKGGETPVNLLLAVLGTHLRPECTISTPKRGEKLVNFMLAVLGAHLRPE